MPPLDFMAEKSGSQSPWASPAPWSKDQRFSQRLTEWWRRLWTSPDPDLVDAGLRGEWLIASLRVLIILLVLYVPIIGYFESGMQRGQQAVLWVAVAALAEALVIYAAVRRSWGRNWIGFFSGILDVSLVTLSLWIFIRRGEELRATQDLVLYPVYLLAIAATSLRYDWRICILTGLSAIFEYAALVSFVVWRFGLTDPYQAATMGFVYRDQLGRLVLLIMATLLSTTLVVRARELRRKSTRDSLTSLANRGFFDDSLVQLEAIASRSDDSIGVAMIDVDHFKRFNDTHGHLAGDLALQRVAATLADSFRNTDLIARYGGEEFAGLFPGMKYVDASRRLDQMRRRIESLPITVGASGETASVTVSMGLAVFPGDGDTLNQTLAIADERLYEAKQRGRNQVVGGPVGEESSL